MNTKNFIFLFIGTFLFSLGAYAEDENFEDNACGPASIVELNSTCIRALPEWLLFAKTEGEIVSIDANGRVIWHSGTWGSGYWIGGRRYLEKRYLEIW